MHERLHPKLRPVWPNKNHDERTRAGWPVHLPTSPTTTHPFYHPPMTTDPSKPACFDMPPLPAEHIATMKVANRLAELIGARKNLDAIHELYAPDARHVEVIAGPGCDRISEGKATILARAEQFHKTTIFHGSTVGKPVVNGDQFLLPMSLDCTATEGPMANHRMNMQETALYTVKNGAITEAKFFYGMGM